VQEIHNEIHGNENAKLILKEIYSKGNCDAAAAALSRTRVGIRTQVSCGLPERRY